MTAQQSKGIWLAIAAALISGISVFANGLVVKGIDPIVHTTVKNSVAGMLAIGVLIASHKSKRPPTLNLKNTLLLISIALVGGSLAFALFFTGLKQIGAYQGTVIHKTLIFWVALLAIPFLKERIPIKMWVGIVLLYLSSMTVGFKGFTALSLGHVFVLLATILWSIENIIAKRTLRQVAPDVLVAARMGMGSLLLASYLFVSGKLPLLLSLTTAQWLMLSGVGVLLFGYVMCWYRALKYVPVTLTASILVGATVITGILEAIFTTHTLSSALLIQTVIILTGLVCVTPAAIDIWHKTRKPVLQEYSITDE